MRARGYRVVATLSCLHKGLSWLTWSLVWACLVSCYATVDAFADDGGRVYELVSPVFKGGFGATISAVAPDGNSVVFSSAGAFAGQPFATPGDFYLARREEGSGWHTTPMKPPFVEAGADDFSATLEYTLGSRAVGATETEGLVHRNGTPDTAEYWEPYFLEPISVKYVNPKRSSEAVLAIEKAASGDLCHVVLEGAELTEESPLGRIEFYDAARGCGGEGAKLQLVGVRNRIGTHGEPEALQGCNVELGKFTSRGYEVGPFGKEQTASFNAVSGDGSEMFFEFGVGGKCTSPQLFVRLGSTRTVEVSRPVDPSLPFGGCGEGAGEVPGEVPCPGASTRAPAFFKGASEDGSRVFFATGATLVPGDTDASNKLYMARIGCPEAEPECSPGQRRVLELLDVSHNRLGSEPAEVQGAVSMGRQAGYVYFVAHGALVGNANTEGEMAVKGAENLYVYDPQTGGLRFVADLCSGAASSGEIEDPRCPHTLSSTVNDVKLWGAGEGGDEAQSTADGRYLVFSSYARLIARGTQIDTDEARDVYRYDAQTGALDRVSLGEGGHDANGNGGGFDASIEPVGMAPGGQGDPAQAQQEMNTRAVSEDGSKIVFVSAEPLSLDATNGHENVYVWHQEPGWSEGRVSMISSGTAPTNDKFPVITPDGNNVFFDTSAGLVPQDTEGDLDVYDARIDGGFPQQPVEREQCSSDACQGALTNPAPLLVPGSVSQAPGQNYPQPAKKATTKKLTRAQQLARGALKACAKKRKSKRAACRRSASKRYAKAAKSAVRGQR
jgi:hypothetical protein